VIAHGHGVVAHLGGWRGDTLSVSRAGEPFRAIAELGWNEGRQTVPQRRMVVADGSILVLEPVDGGRLRPPLCVRRIDLDGNEVDRSEGSDPGDPDLFFAMDWEWGAFPTVIRCGIDPRTGRALTCEDRLDVVLPRWRRTRPHASGTPARSGDGVWWYPLALRGLVCSSGKVWQGDAGPAVAWDGHAVCLSAAGCWVDGVWRSYGGLDIGRSVRMPRGVPAIPVAGRGLVILNPCGGALPVLDGAPGRLPEGRYAGLLPGSAGPMAVTDETPPRLVDVGL